MALGCLLSWSLAWQSCVSAPHHPVQTQRNLSCVWLSISPQLQRLQQPGRPAQDWSYVATSCMELTLELSEDKWPPAERLPGLWEDNKPALLALPLMATLGGIRSAAPAAALCSPRLHAAPVPRLQVLHLHPLGHSSASPASSVRAGGR